MLSEALRFVAESGQFIITRSVTPFVALSHFPPLVGGHGYRQALQLPHENLGPAVAQLLGSLLYGGHLLTIMLVTAEPLLQMSHMGTFL